MKKALILVVIVAILGGFAYFGSQGGQPAAAANLPAKAPAAKVANSVVAQAKVQPVRSVSLSMRAGGFVSEIAVAEGDSVAAGQVLVRLQAEQQQAAVALAEANLSRGRAHLGELVAGARQQEIAQAEAAVSSARAALEKLMAGADQNQLIAAGADLADAEAALQQAQADYDRAGGALATGIGASPVSLRLQQITNAYRAAKARLAVLEGQPRPADVAMARAEVSRSQAQLDLVRSGARRETIDAAEAEVSAAQASLVQARAALAETELRAPFAGVVAALDAKVGEQLAAGSPVVRLADFSAWEIETTDLTEVQVVKLTVGDSTTVTVDALPGVEMAGTIVRIRSLGENRQGDVVYRVTVRPSESDPRLRWNMTAMVNVAAK